MQEIKVYNPSNLPTIHYKNFIDLQGDLKELKDSEFIKLKNLILKRGIRFAFIVWKKDDKFYTIDGHQRLKVLKKLEESMSIPDIPYYEIFAEDEKTAKDKSRQIKVSSTRTDCGDSLCPL